MLIRWKVIIVIQILLRVVSRSLLLCKPSQVAYRSLLEHAIRSFGIYIWTQKARVSFFELIDTLYWLYLSILLLFQNLPIFSYYLIQSEPEFSDYPLIAVLKGLNLLLEISYFLLIHFDFQSESHKLLSVIRMRLLELFLIETRAEVFRRQADIFSWFLGIGINEIVSLVHFPAFLLTAAPSILELHSVILIE